MIVTMQADSVIRCSVTLVLAALLNLAAAQAVADDGRKLPTVGLAIPVDAKTSVPFENAFVQGLRDLGWVEGTNIKLVRRYSDGDPVKLRELVRELIDLKVDVLWGDAQVLKEATSTIPIVSPTMTDPVVSGLVPSLSHPGGNLTGMSFQADDIAHKHLELAKETLPKLTRLYVLFDRVQVDFDAIAYVNGKYSELARRVGITVRPLPVATLDDIQGALKIIQQEQAQALIVWPYPLIAQHRDLIMKSIAHRLPVLSTHRMWAESGAVQTYGADPLDVFRRSAGHVNRILKGAKPGDLPIEQPIKFNMVINLNAAKRLGIAIPESVLVRADEVIR